MCLGAALLVKLTEKEIEGAGSTRLGGAPSTASRTHPHAPLPLLRPPRCAGTWFERRLAYTRSMAVNSMAGHIIGLGDRHLQVG